MPVSAVLDTVIGLSFAFFLLSVASSTIAEGIATFLGKRSKYLLRGLRAMLDAAPVAAPSPGRSVLVNAVRAEQQLYEGALAALKPAPAPPAGPAAVKPAVVPPALDRFLRHPLVASQAQHRAGSAEATRPPSYLAASTFAAVVLDEFLADDPHRTLAGRVAAAPDLPDPLRKVLATFAREVDSDVARFAALVENWYDAQMARVSGAYKRWVKRWVLVVAAVVVLGLHVDALSLAGTLWHDPEVRQAAVALASPTACPAPSPAGDTAGDTGATQNYLKCLNQEAEGLRGAGVPIGLPGACGFTDPVGCLLPQAPADRTVGDAIAVIAGLALSVLAVSFGAPFWFQVLTRFASLRNTGDKPPPAQPS